MYPYLSGPAAAVTMAAMLREHDVSDAAARSTALRARELAHRREVRVAALATPPETRELHRWLVAQLPHPHLHKRPPAIP